MLSGTLILTIIVTCFGSSLVCGYNISVINLPVQFIMCFLTRTIFDQLEDPKCQDFILLRDSGGNITETVSLKAEILYSSLASIFVASGAMGAFLSGLLADLVGRKVGLLLNHIPMVIGGALILPAVKLHSVPLLFAARGFAGLNCGVAIAMASMYLTEIAPIVWRGAIGACHQLAITVGIVFGYIFTMDVTMKSSDLWPIALVIIIAPAVISAVILPFLPESPRYLYIKKGHTEKAKSAFILFNKGPVEEFVDEMELEIADVKSRPKFRFFQLFTDRTFRKPLLITLTLQIMQQLCGINAVINYSSLMLQSAGVADSMMDAVVVSTGLLNIICSIIVLPLLEKLGRRTLLLIPSLLIIVSLILLPISVHFSNQSTTETMKLTLGYFSISLILIYIIGFGLGLGPIPVLFISEVFTQAPRGTALSVNQAVMWLSYLLVQQTYPIVNKMIGECSFLPFLAVVVVCWIILFFIMPETHGKTVEDISKQLRGDKSVEDTLPTKSCSSQLDIKA